MRPDRGREIVPYRIHVGELGEGPAAVAAGAVHAWYPVGLHGRFFLFGVLASVALDLDHEVEQVVVAVAIVHEHDEVGEVGARLGAVPVGDLQPQTVVLDVGADRRLRLDEATELGLPVAVADYPVDVAAARVGLPAGPLRGGEVDVNRRAGRVVGVEHGRDRAVAEMPRVMRVQA